MSGYDEVTGDVLRLAAERLDRERPKDVHTVTVTLQGTHGGADMRVEANGDEITYEIGGAIRREPVTEEQVLGGERLYQLARDQAKHKWGAPAFRMLGYELKRAVILAEVLHVIAANDMEAARNMMRLADYAVTRVLADTQPPGSPQ